MSKPSPGVCGPCGTAVVQDPEPKHGWCLPPGVVLDWHQPSFGHLFNIDLNIDPVAGRLKLVKVRCFNCADIDQRDRRNS